MAGTSNGIRCRALGVFLLAGLGAALPAWGSTVTLPATRDASITGSTVDHYSPSNYGLPVNVFDSTQALIDFNLSSIPANATISSIALHFDEISEANANGMVSVNGYGRSGAITAADATAPATQFGSYNSVALGTGQQSVPLNAAADTTLQSLLGSSDDLGLRLTGISDDTNTSIGSIEQLPSFAAPSLVVTYSVVPEPTSIGLLLGAAGMLLPFARRAARRTWPPPARCRHTGCNS